MTIIISDSFTGADGSNPDPELWTESLGGAYVSIQSNKLNFTAATDHRLVTLLAMVAGDFDVQVDFDITAGPDTNSWGAFLYAYFANDDGFNVGISYDGDVRKYTFQSWIDPDWTEHGSSASADTSGKFRLVRSGSSYTGYFWNGTGWTSLGTHSTGPTADIYIALEHTDWASGVTTSGNFDNFMMTLPGVPLASTLSLVNSIYVGSTLFLVNSLNAQIESDLNLVLSILRGLEGSFGLKMSIEERDKFNGTLKLLTHILDADSGITQGEYYFLRNHGL
jgi:hypothetical protein